MLSAALLLAAAAPAAAGVDADSANRMALAAELTSSAELGDLARCLIREARELAPSRAPPDDIIRGAALACQAETLVQALALRDMPRGLDAAERHQNVRWRLEVARRELVDILAEAHLELLRLLARRAE